ncbi:MAG: hypothetical protein CM15mP84_05290 [Cellvibrionales bacterium]|nr:MAG: hypothetical protein CM15mP84_05290 [Cellvibrionales bacterium]
MVSNRKDYTRTGKGNKLLEPRLSPLTISHSPIGPPVCVKASTAN